MLYLHSSQLKKINGRSNLQYFQDGKLHVGLKIMKTFEGNMTFFSPLLFGGNIILIKIFIFETDFKQKFIPK